MCFKASYKFTCDHRLYPRIVTCAVSDQRPDRAICDPLDPDQVITIEDGKCDQCDPTRREANALVVQQDEDRMIADRIARQQTLPSETPPSTSLRQWRDNGGLTGLPMMSGALSPSNIEDSLERALRLSLAEHEGPQPNDDTLERALRLSAAEYEASQHRDDPLERALRLSAAEHEAVYANDDALQEVLRTSAREYEEGMREDADDALERALCQSAQEYSDVEEHEYKASIATVLQASGAGSDIPGFDMTELEQAIEASRRSALEDDLRYYASSKSTASKKYYTLQSRWACGCIYSNGYKPIEEASDAHAVDGIIWKVEDLRCARCEARWLDLAAASKGKGKAKADP